MTRHDVSQPTNGDGHPPAAEVLVVEHDRPAPAVVEAEPTTRETTLQAVGQVVFQCFLGLIVLGVAAALTAFLVNQKTAPAKLPPAREVPTVSVLRVSNEARPVDIRGYGNVRAARTISLSAQVGGRVVSINPQLVAGGELPAGATVLTIDPTDYDLSIELAQANVARAEAGLERVESRRRAAQATVAQAQTQLQTERAEADVAREEFGRLNPGEAVPPLVGREPQVRQAEAGLQAAEAALADVDAEEKELEAARSQALAELRQARVNRERAEVKLPEGGGPFRVSTESVDVGQTVSIGQTFAEVYDASTLEVAVPLEDAQLAYIDFAGRDEEQLKSAGLAEDAAREAGDLSDDQAGSAASISADFAGAERTWPGRVVRTEGQIDPRTRLVQVIVVADDPTSEDGGARLVPGLFAEVQIDGKPVRDAAVIPRRALREPDEPDSGSGPSVYVAEEGRLQIVPVEVVRRSGDETFVRGLSDGAAVISSRLDVVAPGMEVRVEDDGTTRPAL